MNFSTSISMAVIKLLDENSPSLGKTVYLGSQFQVIASHIWEDKTRLEAASLPIFLVKSKRNKQACYLACSHIAFSIYIQFRSSCLGNGATYRGLDFSTPIFSQYNNL